MATWSFSHARATLRQTSGLWEKKSDAKKKAQKHQWDAGAGGQGADSNQKTKQLSREAPHSAINCITNSMRISNKELLPKNQCSQLSYG